MTRATTPLGKLLLEAIGGAIVFTVLFFGVHAAAMALFAQRAMTSHLLLASQVALAALLGHLLAEGTGLNAWYCRQC